MTAQPRGNWDVWPGIPPILKLLGLCLVYHTVFYHLGQTGFHGGGVQLALGLGNSFFQCFWVNIVAGINFVDFTDSFQQSRMLSLRLSSILIPIVLGKDYPAYAPGH